jgi:hypothetical protein
VTRDRFRQSVLPLGLRQPGSNELDQDAPALQIEAAIEGLNPPMVSSLDSRLFNSEKNSASRQQDERTIDV